MTKTYSLPNLQNVLSGFLQTRFVVLCERLEIKGVDPARETERRGGPCEIYTLGQVVKEFQPTALGCVTLDEPLHL